MASRAVAGHGIVERQAERRALEQRLELGPAPLERLGAEIIAVHAPTKACFACVTLRFVKACAIGLEGIVPKRATSRYRSGRPSDWVKAKNPQSAAARREAIEDWNGRGAIKFAI